MKKLQKNSHPTEFKIVNYFEYVIHTLTQVEYVVSAIHTGS